MIGSTDRKRTGGWPFNVVGLTVTYYAATSLDMLLASLFTNASFVWLLSGIAIITPLSGTGELYCPGQCYWFSVGVLT